MTQDTSTVKGDEPPVIPGLPTPGGPHKWRNSAEKYLRALPLKLVTILPEYTYRPILIRILSAVSAAVLFRLTMCWAGRAFLREPGPTYFYWVSVLGWSVIVVMFLGYHIQEAWRGETAQGWPNNLATRPQIAVQILAYLGLCILAFPLALPLFEEIATPGKLIQIGLISLTGTLLIGYVRLTNKTRDSSMLSTCEIILKKGGNLVQVLTVFALLSVSALLIVRYKGIFENLLERYQNQILPMVPIAVLLLLILWLFPKISVRSLSGATLGSKQSELDREKEKLNLEDNARKTLSQIIGGLLIVGSLIVAYSVYQVNVQQLGLDREKLLREGMDRASAQLNSDEPQTREDGLRSLDNYALISAEDYWKIMEKIASHIRTKSRRAAPVASPTPSRGTPNASGRGGPEEKLPKDIQFALNILGRRNLEKDPEGKKLDLSGANLTDADLSNLNFSKADLSDTILNNADLNNTVLTGANLSNVKLSKARILFSNLSGTSLVNANLTDSVIRQSDMTNADLMSADLTNAQLIKVIFRETKTDRAIFKDADFIEVDTLSFEQAVLAIFDEKTTFPDNLVGRRPELLAASRETERK